MKTTTIKEVEFTKEELEQALEELNKPEFDYPLYKRCIVNHSDKGMIVKFNSLKGGLLVKKAKDGLHSPGTHYSTWTPHTNKDAWEDVIFNEERGLSWEC